jgi:hypothetical protein
MENNIMILTQVIFKGFIEVEKRLPVDDFDVEQMKLAILKTYKAGLVANSIINKK